ncbi:hypothetical protein EXIGLDRAFT_843527, partial [Exidia glandulosa HHB12029]
MTQNLWTRGFAVLQVAVLCPIPLLGADLQSARVRPGTCWPYLYRCSSEEQPPSRSSRSVAPRCYRQSDIRAVGYTGGRTRTVPCRFSSTLRRAHAALAALCSVQSTELLESQPSTFALCDRV